nr:hypothetical protein Q903MT_gene1573 [Picea sitchensis]
MLMELMLELRLGIPFELVHIWGCFARCFQ